MAVNPSADAPAASIQQQLDDLFAPWSRTDAPGLSVGVVKDGAPLYRRGFGMASLESGTQITPVTKLRIGSTTKHFTALLALLLEEDGKLDLDAPIRTYLPELTGPGGDPSLRLLLQHRGGSRCYLDLGFIAHGVAIAPVGRALEMQVRQRDRNFPVGEAMIYNNGGYHLVSLAIERAGGASLGDQMKSRLFDVIGMPNTELVLSDYALVPGMATCHLPLPDGGWRRGIFPTEDIKGEGGLVSNIDDMLRWIAHLRSQDRFGARASWEALFSQPVYPDGTTGCYGLGIMVGTYRGASVFHHGGGVAGGSSEMMSFPDHGLDIAVLINGARGADPNALALKVADIVLGDALTDRPGPVDTGPYRSLLGYWWSDATGMIYELRDEQDTLKIGLCGTPIGFNLEAVDPDHVQMALGGFRDVTLNLTAGLETGTIPIRFGISTDSYVRVTPDSSRDAPLKTRAVGRYDCHDADCTAEIFLKDGALAMTIGDGFGQSRGKLKILGETAALLRIPAPYFPVFAALSFDADAPVSSGFRLCTGRTRNLRFKRV